MDINLTCLLLYGLGGVAIIGVIFYFISESKAH